jgi:hypothetical protein
MKAIILPNGLTRKTTNCLTKAGIVIEKKAIAKALKTGTIYPYYWPASYGLKTHLELCRWAGIDANTQLSPASEWLGISYPNNGLSYRANRCLRRGGIPATKKAVCHALQTGALCPGKCPGSYGKQTHMELCKWVGLKDKSKLPF